MNYWHILANADRALAGGDFVGSERLLTEARLTREASRGRVFWSERLVDTARRAWYGLANRGDSTPPGGRWPLALADFQVRFRDRAEATVREAVRLADLRPEDAAEANQPVIESALYLVTRSSLFGEEPSSAVVLLKGLLRTAQRTGRLCDVSLLRHDLPLTAEDRLWLARRGYALLTELAADPAVTTTDDATDRRRQWAAALVRLLHERYFAPVSRLQEERAWSEVIITDHLLGDAVRAVELYRAYLALNPEPGNRSDEARVRTLELLVNVTGQHNPIPLYSEAQQSLRAAALAPGSVLTDRLATALELIEQRRPSVQPSLAWVSAAGTADHLVFVVWWQDEPRDVAFWTPGSRTDVLATFLAPCEGRVVWVDDAARAVLPADQEWADGWPIDPFVVALLEPSLPSAGLSSELRHRLALAEAGAWRAGWNRLQGHPLLEPPRRADRLESTRGDGVAEAVTAGLLWRACLSRVVRADPTLRAGFGELARRGDPAARTLYSCLALGDETGRALDASFQPWLLPLLWTRPDPLSEAAVEGVDGPRLDRPDLAGSRVAVVSSGNPAAVAVAWASGQRRMRVVLDRPDRVSAVAPLASGSYGPVTLVPPDGAVHDLAAALSLLEELVTREAVGDPQDRLLAVFHWIRLVETHNGDLLDFMAVRSRANRPVGFYARYRELVAELPKLRPRLSDGAGETSWAEQYSQRARRSGLVVGSVDDLDPQAGGLDDTWGVYEGSEVAWLFLDSAAVHWRLLARGEEQLQRLHEALAKRGRRHLSLLTVAVFARTELEDQLARWLTWYGEPYRLTLDDVVAPRLYLAAGGVAPDARLLPAACGAGQLARLAAVGAEGRACSVHLPAAGIWREFWTDAIAAALGTLPGEPRRARAVPSGDYVLVPELAAFGNSPEVWSGDRGRADRRRSDWGRVDRARRQQAAQIRAACSLEINALLAGGAESIDIADPRWWRIMRPERASSPHDAVWTAARALAVAAAGRAETYDLTLPAATERRRGNRAPVGTATHWYAPVLRWLQARAVVDENGVGDLAEQSPVVIEPPEPVSAPLPTQIEFCRGDADRRWRDLAVAALVAWERGELAHYALAIAAEPPCGAAALLAGTHVVGDTVWPAHGEVEPIRAPGPLLWLHPDDFLRPEVLHALQLYRPHAIWVGDLAGWLPAVDRPRSATATALRWLMNAGAARCVVAIDGVSDPWVRYLSECIAGSESPGRIAIYGGAGDDGAFTNAQGAASAGLASAAPVAIGRADGWQVICPRCGADVCGDEATVSCPRCCLPAVNWLNPTDRRTLARKLTTARFEALLRRDDLGHPLPLQVWLPPGHAQQLVREIERGRFTEEISVRRTGRQWSLSVGATRRWSLASREDLQAFDSECDHALLYALPPSSTALPPWPGDAQGSLSSWYHPIELDDRPREQALVRTRRLWRLLREAAQVCQRQPDADEPEKDLVPLSYLTFLSGIEARELMEGVNTARWLALLAGDPVSAVADLAHGDTEQALAAGLAYAEIEADGQRLMNLLPALLGEPLATVEPGQTVRIDLSELGERHDRDLVSSLDRLLCAWSLQLPFCAEQASAVTAADEPERGAGQQLLYRPETGSLFSDRRLVGCLGEPQSLLIALREQMDDTLATIRRLWADAGRDAEGVHLVLTSDTNIPRRLPAIGSMLHWWRWEGTGSADALPLIDLLTLVDSATLHADTAASELWRELLEHQDRWRDSLRQAWPEGVLEVAPQTWDQAVAEPSRRRFGLLRSERPVAHELAAVRVGEFSAPGGDGSNLLVLRGMTGSGRSAAVVAGIGRSFRQGTAPAEVTYHCPDSATAARLHVALRRMRCDLSPDIEIAGERQRPQASPSQADLGRDTVEVVLEAQRFTAEERYRVSERARPGRLIMTVDMAEATEPWENMFLTTPGREEVVTLDRQVRQTRRLWTEVRELLPPATTAHERSLRRDKGHVAAHWAANLDECVACLLAEYEAGRLRAPVALSAPLTEDCTYLGRALAARDWLPVFRRELDELLLPGLLEFLAAISDVWMSAGQLRAAAADGATQPVQISGYAGGTDDSLLTALLTDARRGSYRSWLTTVRDEAASTTPARLYESLAGTAWAAPVFAPPAARYRVEKLLAKLGDESLAAFVQRPLWEAWWYEVLALTGRTAPAERRPVVTLNTADYRPGRFATDGVYLCLGGEPDSVHYRVLGRISDRCLVLYQEHSPLPSSTDGDTGRPGAGLWR